MWPATVAVLCMYYVRRVLDADTSHIAFESPKTCTYMHVKKKVGIDLNASGHAFSNQHGPLCQYVSHQFTMVPDFFFSFIFFSFL
jgi:hypothetical protein